MQSTSQLFEDIVAGDYYEVRSRIYINNAYLDEDGIYSITTVGSVFGDSGYPAIGRTTARTLDAKLRAPLWVNIPDFARIEPYVCVTDGTNTSEWIPKGKFNVDTRKVNDAGDILTISCYDDMVKANLLYTTSNLTWPATDIAVVNEIASQMGVTVDSRTTALITNAYSIPEHGKYTKREMLGYIASMYGGSFIMSDAGELLFIQLCNYSNGTVTADQMKRFTKRRSSFTITKIVLQKDDDTSYEAGGTESGYTLTVENPFATQAMADNIMTAIGGKAYLPFDAQTILVDPSAELGDGITINNNITSGIYKQTIRFGHGNGCDISAPSEEEHRESYEYTSPDLTKYKREIGDINAAIEVNRDNITAKVDKTGGDPSSFGWTLTDNSWAIESDGETVFEVDDTGAHVKGEIEAESGSFGPFVIDSDGFYYDYDHDEGWLDSSAYLGLQTGGLSMKKRSNPAPDDPSSETDRGIAIDSTGSIRLYGGPAGNMTQFIGIVNGHIANSLHEFLVYDYIGNKTLLDYSAQTGLATSNIDYDFTGDTNLVLVLDIPAFSALPITISDSNITADHIVAESTLGTPSAQDGDWTVTTAAGSVTVSGNISGSTTLRLVLVKPRDIS